MFDPKREAESEANRRLLDALSQILLENEDVPASHKAVVLLMRAAASINDKTRRIVERFAVTDDDVLEKQCQDCVEAVEYLHLVMSGIDTFIELHFGGEA